MRLQSSGESWATVGFSSSSVTSGLKLTTVDSARNVEPRHLLGQAALLAVLTTLLSGCIPLPIPTRATAPRYSSAQIESVGQELQSRDSIEAKLGSPDLRREGDRIWIYKWRVDRGKWFALPLAPLVAGDIGPISSHQFLLVLEFDANGLLLSKEFATQSKGHGEKRYCTDSSLCIEHRVQTGEVDSHGAYLEDFRNQGSAVTVSGPKRERIARPEPRSDECLAVIWPEEDWRISGDFFSLAHLGGLNLAVRAAGAIQSSEYVWVPVGAFSQFALPAGAQAVDALDSEAVQATFECAQGQEIYLAIGGSGKKRHEFPIVLRPVDATVGRAAIANMAQVLWP